MPCPDPVRLAVAIVDRRHQFRTRLGDWLVAFLFCPNCVGLRLAPRHVWAKLRRRDCSL